MLQSFAAWIFEPDGLSPHGFCLLWEPWLVWAHALGNIGIALAYFSIPVVLLRFARRRRDLVFKPVFWLFAAFILLCGTGHLADLLTLWVPAYRLETGIKVATALVSLATAAVLWPLLPRALALPSPAQLRDANAALAASEARYRASFLHSPMPLHTQDRNGVITGVSERWLDLLGYPREAVVGRNLAGFLEPGSRRSAEADWRRLLAEGEIRDVECRMLRSDGRVLDVLVSARTEHGPGAAEDSARRVLGALVDVTDHRRAEAALRETEERMRQTQKMEALGQLAGGVAHDFNNVLQAVAGGAALIRRRIGDPAAVHRLAGLIADSATRGAATCRRLLSFARRTELEAGPVEVHGLLAGLREILVHTIGAGITVQVDAPEDIPPLLADRGELETVLVNLAANARDAMPAGGTLTLAARPEQVAASELPHRAGLAAGSYVRITVTDTGMGMDAATLARAAEPFFTTKETGKGTGLGLAMARGFAQQSNGGFAISSAPRQGTTVTLWMPVAPLSAGGAEPGTAKVPERDAAGLGAGGVAPLVLLVDDEPIVRAVLAAELEDHGFRVRQAESPQAALDVLADGEPLGLLVTDLSMPGMDGVRLIQEAQRRQPGLRAILMTGYATEAATLAISGALSGTFTLLRKPVAGADLADRAAMLLEQAGTGR